MEKDQTIYTARASPMRLGFRVSYLGSRFFGSQMQEAHRTVEGEFVATCQRLSLFSDWRKAGFLFAGRTDRGVHACGQIAAFSTDFPDRAILTMNLKLPPDCWCTGFAEVPPEFHPRFDAKSRTYRYYFSKSPSDISSMERAAHSFTGCHNFTNFARVGDKNPWRNILEIKIGENEGFHYLEVKAESFCGTRSGVWLRRFFKWVKMNRMKHLSHPFLKTKQKDPCSQPRLKDLFSGIPTAELSGLRYPWTSEAARIWIMLCDITR